jgi:hypothetical protein
MAHVIARSSDGPRGIPGTTGPNTYDNFILFCPCHHTMVDKAPDDFPENRLRQWKNEHEFRIEQALAGIQFPNAKSLFNFATKLLIENQAIHKKYGPESVAAKDNPLSEGAILWSLRKCDTILPNNRKIVNAFVGNRDYLSLEQWQIFADFREHAIALERNTYERMDRNIVPRFPRAFHDMIIFYAE